MTRQLRILLLTAVVLGGLVLIAVNPFQDQIRKDNPVSNRLFSFDIKSVDGLRIQSGDRTFELTKTGDSWAVASEGDFPADTASVGRILRAMGKAMGGEVVSRNPEKRDLFAVTPQAGVEVRVSSGGSEEADFVVGKAGTDYRSSYVQKSGEDTVYLVSGMNKNVFAPPAGFRDRRITEFSPSEIVQLAWAAADTGWAIGRQDSAWLLTSPDGTRGEADPAQVQVLLASASRLTADMFAEGDSLETGLQDPSYVLSVNLTDGQEVRVLVGDQDLSGRLYARRDGLGVVYLLSEWNLKQFRKRAKAFLKTE